MNLVNLINLSSPKQSWQPMNIPLLSRTSSLQSSQEYEHAQCSQSQGRNSTLANSHNNYSSQLTKSNVSSRHIDRLLTSSMPITPCSFQEKSFSMRHFCEVHGNKFGYTCITCLDHVCFQCLRDPTQHRSHRFQRYNQKKEDLKLTQRQLSAKKDEINRIICMKEDQKAAKLEQGKIKQEKLRQHSRKMVEVYENIREINDQCNGYRAILKQFNQYYNLSLAELKNTSRVGLISSTGERIAQSYNLKIQQVSDWAIVPSNLIIPNLIKPDPFSCNFEVDRFSQAKKLGEERIFLPFQAFQSLWRLKVYPSGYCGAKVEERHAGIQYMSVYVERLDGVVDIASYTIRIQTTSPAKPRLRIKKQFQSEFTRNESWGYDRFTRLSNIYEHGFLGQDDKLFIKISICPITYCESTKALTAIISQKQRIKQENERRIKILKVLLQQKMQARLIDSKSPSTQLGTPRKLESFRVQFNQKGMAQEETKQEVRGRNHLSAGVIQEIKGKLFEGAGSYGISRCKPIYGSISFEKASPPKLIRLVSLKNMVLIENSKKMHSRRSSTIY